jgi:hypothetical protein
MAYIVKAFTPGKLNLAPETLEEEVLQNVAIIVSTPKFSVPLDRGLGLAQRFIEADTGCTIYLDFGGSGRGRRV